MSQFRPQTQLAGIDSLLKDECVFFGTGYISRHSLEALQTVFAIEAVVTKSDRLVNGRAQPTAVSQWAQEHKIPLYHADSARDIEEVLEHNRLRSHLAVVIDYGVIIPQSVIDYFPLGIVNSHFSLLPHYRGPNPIRATLLAGDAETGVSLIRITPELDEGPIIAQETVTITEDDSARSLTQKLLEKNATLLTSELLRYVRGEIDPVPQDESQASWSQKTKKHEGEIDWEKPAVQIEREIRAYTDWPKSRTVLAGKDVVVTQAHAVADNAGTATPGTITTEDNGEYIAVQTGEGTVRIEKLKPAGKAEMAAADFIRGYLK